MAKHRNDRYEQSCNMDEGGFTAAVRKRHGEPVNISRMVTKWATNKLYGVIYMQHFRWTHPSNSHRF